LYPIGYPGFPLLAGNSYQVGDQILLTQASTGGYVFDGKMQILKSGAYGDCIKGDGIKFMKDIAEDECGFSMAISL
jgi:hypothetical protein